MKNNILRLICFICCITCLPLRDGQGMGHLHARQYASGEKLYVNVDQSGRDGSGNINWSDAGAHLMLYIWKAGVSGSQQWIDLAQEDGTVYYATIPAGNWDKCIILRKNASDPSHNFSNVWDRTGEGGIDLIDNPAVNCIYHFWTGGDGSDWKTFCPATDKIPSLITSISEELVKVCPSALDGPFALHPKIKPDHTDYEYDNTRCSEWYKSTDKTSWVAMTGLAGAGNLHDGQETKDVDNNQLPAILTGGAIYYYLHAADPAYSRLMKVVTDGTGCELDCTISSFEIACSDVNANDTTYTLDGMVAFGEANGSLVVSCDGKSTTITNPKSPQIFSIEGLPAAVTGGKTTTAIAHFTGNGSCTASATVQIPNATQGITTYTVDVMVGQSATLSPTGAISTNAYEWYIEGEKQTDAPQTFVTTAKDETNTTVYVYKEFNPPAGDMKDMIGNGGYDTTDVSIYGTKGQKSLISDYMFWGQYPQTDATDINFYHNTTINPSGWDNNGFAVVKNANNFFHTYAKITAHERQYFGLFDAATGTAGGNKKAWYTTTAQNPNLKLQKGTTYLFSFWAANINNYGEMDNAARLQFQIEYNGKTKKLGEVLDLGTAEFHNNVWHQCSSTFLADEDAASVTISVMNLNTDAIRYGNDFALDDIQFRAVSSQSRAVRTQQQFIVRTHEPHLYSLKTSVGSMPCDSMRYPVTLTIEYDNPLGKLVVRDETANTELLNAELLAAGATPDWDKHKTKQISFVLDTLTAATHTYKAYFAERTQVETTGTSTAPAFTPCPPEITCLEGVMYRKWDNVLFVSNADSVYHAYQWYKNSARLNGETKQYLYLPSASMSGTTDLYSCEMVRRADGKTERTCEHTFDETPASATADDEMVVLDQVTVSPTLLRTGATITIMQPTAQVLTVTMLSMDGTLLLNETITERQHRLTAPAGAGLYLLQLQQAGSLRAMKIVVID